MEPLGFNESVAARYWRQYLRLQKGFDVELKRILEQAAKDVQRLISRLPDEQIGQLVRKSQYQAQYGSLVSMMDDLWGEVLDLSQKGVKNAAALGAKGSMQLLEVLTNAARESGLSGSRLLADGLQRQAQMAVENVQSRLINSIDLSHRVYRNQALSLGQVDRVVNNGLALSKSAREIAADVRRLISPRAPGGVSYSAMRLGRTEVNNAFHTTQTRAYAEQPWVTGVKWQTSGSHPRPDICDEFAKDDSFDMGAGVFPRGNVPGKPHPQCLCHVVAITVSREEFIDELLAGSYGSFLNI